MRTAAYALIALGVSSFLFPLIGRRSLILGVFGPYEQIAAIVSIVLGAIALGLSLRKPPAGDKPAGS
jgi:hypothetical protein